MTREEAKQWLEAMKSAYALPIETYEAIDMAIEALQWQDKILTQIEDIVLKEHGERAEQTDKYPWEAIPCDDPERQERINNYKEYHMPGHDEVTEALDNLKVEFVVKGEERVKRIKEEDND